MAFFVPNVAIFESHILEKKKFSWEFRAILWLFFNVPIIGGYLVVLWLFQGILVTFHSFNIFDKFFNFHQSKNFVSKNFLLSFFYFQQNNKNFARIRLIFKWLFWLFFLDKIGDTQKWLFFQNLIWPPWVSSL